MTLKQKIIIALGIALPWTLLAVLFSSRCWEGGPAWCNQTSLTSYLLPIISIPLIPGFLIAALLSNLLFGHGLVASAEFQIINFTGSYIFASLESLLVFQFIGFIKSKLKSEKLSVETNITRNSNFPKEEHKEPSLLKVILIVLGIVGGLFLLIVLAVGFIFLSIFKDSSPKTPIAFSDKSYLNNRTEIIGEVTKEIKVIKDKLPYHYYDTGTHEKCYRVGNYNGFGPQVSPFTFSCTYKLTDYYAFNGNLEDKLESLSKILAKESWEVKAYSSEIHAKKNKLNLEVRRTYRNKKPDYKTEKPWDAINYNQTINRNPVDKVLGIPEIQDFVDGEALYNSVIKEYEFIISISIEKDYFQYKEQPK